MNWIDISLTSGATCKADLIRTQLLQSVDIFNGQVITVQLRCQSSMGVAEIYGCPFLYIGNRTAGFGTYSSVWTSE